MATEQRSEGVTLRVRNIAGIEESEVSFSPGVTALRGRNATNRTSLLRAVLAALGSSDVSLKGDADRGEVELTLDGETYTRVLERTDDGITMRGDPYTEESELVDLFAALLESNEARRAVARGDDLRELIMRPVDTEAIEAQIRRLEEQKTQYDEALSNIESQKRALPDLERKRKTLESDIEDIREQLSAKEEELEAADANIDQKRKERTQLSETLESMDETRSRLDDIRFDIETERESLSSLRTERSELDSERQELARQSVDENDDLEDRIDRLRSQKSQIDSELSRLQSTIQFNEDALGGASERNGDVWLDAEEPEHDSLTDQLLESDETVVCWTCGSHVDREQVRATIDQLQDRQREKLAERNRVQDELADLTAAKKEAQEQRRERERLERRASGIEDEIEEREQRLEELDAEREDLIDEVDRLETQIEELEEQEFSEILDLHREANQLEFELGKLERELSEVKSEIAGIEEQLEEREEIEAQREETREELADLRTRIDQIERDAVEKFNDQMETVLDILEYENLERIWIERLRGEPDTGRGGSQSTFQLHIVRSTESGVTYEDTIDHLSESEREVTGLVFALAGYLVHEVYEVVPFMILDSLEAVDSDRIAILVDHFEEFPDFLVAALLPEDAAALDDSYERITDI